MKYFLCIICILIGSSNSFAQKPPVRIWFDTDMMMGMPDTKPREVDDGVTLMMALRQPEVSIAGISTVTYVDYGADLIRNYILPNYGKRYPGGIPVYKGSPKADDVGVKNEATEALYQALKKEKLTLLAIGPVTNVATLLLNHPEVASQIDSVVMCIGRQPGKPFDPGLGRINVYDYNYEKDTASMNVLLRSKVHLVFAGFESSSSLLIHQWDIRHLKTSSKAPERWLYDVLTKWQKRAETLFGVNGFIPYDATPLGIITHPQYFKSYHHIPVEVVYRENDSPLAQPTIKRKPFLEVDYRYGSGRTVHYVHKCLPGFEELILPHLTVDNE